MDPVTFSNNVFDESPKDPNAILLELQDMDMGDLFEFLLIVFTNGLQKLYGNDNDKVDLSQISTEQFSRLNQYFNSFGFECVYIVYPIEAECQINFNKLSYRNNEINNDTQLEQLCLPIKVQDKIYVIGFKFRLTGNDTCK
jgi:hypothetical protein